MYKYGWSPDIKCSEIEQLLIHAQEIHMEDT